MPDTPLSPPPPPLEVSVLRVAAAGSFLSLLGALFSALWWDEATTTFLVGVLVGAAIAAWGWKQERVPEKSQKPSASV